jgi:hypothetical protein
MNPARITFPSDHEDITDWATHRFEKECLALQECEEEREPEETPESESESEKKTTTVTCPRTPQFYGAAVFRQNRGFEYRGGYLHVLVMSTVPGRAVTEINKNDLTDEERVRVKMQLVEILE